MINPQWLELPMSRTNFHGPKDVRAIEVRLYMNTSDKKTGQPDQEHCWVLYITKVRRPIQVDIGDSNQIE